MANTKNVLRFIIIFQYLPRLYLIFPLTSQIVEATGVVTETAWAGAAYNLMLFMLASHVMGASWYLLSIERQEACWRTFCLMEDKSCEDKFFDCESFNETNRNTWFKTSNVSTQCVPTSGFYQFGIYGEAVTSQVTSALFFNKYFYCLWFYQFGIYGEAVTSQVTSALFFNKYFYCLWFGLKNLSSLGQNFSTIKAISEVEAFALIAEDLKFVTSQYRRLHSKQLRHKFRFYSHQWRTWAACFVQAAWRRYKRRQSARELRALESFASVDYEPEASPPTRVGLEQPGLVLWLDLSSQGSTYIEGTSLARVNAKSVSDESDQANSSPGYQADSSPGTTQGSGVMGQSCYVEGFTPVKSLGSASSEATPGCVFPPANSKTCNNDKSLSEIQLGHEMEDKLVVVAVKVVHELDYRMVVREIEDVLLEDMEQDIDDDEKEDKEDEDGSKV
ncbi:CNGC15b-like protein [Tanacetum coccineum]